MKFQLVVIALMFMSTLSLAKTLKLTEKSIFANLDDNVPKLQEIEATFLNAKAQYKGAQDKLGAEIYGNRTYDETRERPLIDFFPVYNPINQYQVGIKKNFKYGISADLSQSFDQRTGGSGTLNINNATTIINSLNLNFDLWKDLFGKLTRAQLDNAKLLYSQAKLQKRIEKKAFDITLRRVYYALVANEEKQKVQKTLLNLAKSQAQDARKRKRNSIADVGEVARYESQVEARKGSLFYLQYERENLFKTLRQYIPKFNEYELELSSYDLGSKINDVLQCTAVISSQRVAPYKYTYYDEMKDYLQKALGHQEVVDKSYDDIDVKITTGIRYTGVGNDNLGSNNYRGSTDLAMEDLENNNRMGFNAGVMVSIPIGGEKAATRKVKEVYTKKKYRAQIKNIDANLQSTHRQINESIKILMQVIDAQKQNSKKLKVRLKDMRKKYNQARVSVNALIQDQDALMSSDLSIIDTQLQIVNTILDYLIVFQETPCAFNRI
jgi:outer membrane protein TolC